jgi:GH24 family phage-related lysozyme (muramidase)
MDDYLDDLLVWERCVAWPYCDERGDVTIGIGNMIPSASAMAALPMHYLAGMEPATDDAKMTAYDNVKAAFAPGTNALAYIGCSGVRLDRVAAEELLRRRILGEFLPALRATCPSFDGYPLSARRALVDMIYNLGGGWPPGTKSQDDPGGGLRMFVHMIAACNSVPPDWGLAAGTCHRRGCRPARNDWTRRMFEDAAATTHPVAGDVATEKPPR